MEKSNGGLSSVKNEDLDFLTKNPQKFWENVKYINPGAFANCTDLRELVIPEGVEELSVSVFDGLTNLRSVVFPNSITKLGVFTFQGCENLQNVVLPENIDLIGEYFFKNCSSLKNIVIPASVKIIRHDVFVGCKNLESITIKLNTKSEYEDGYRLSYGKFTFYNIFDNAEEYTYYLSKSGSIELRKGEDKSLEGNAFEISMEEAEDFLKSSKLRNNYLKLRELAEQGKLKFVPPTYTLKTFPTECIEDYFVNNNDKRWGRLVKTLKFDTLEGNEKTNTLVDLMKIYYAIGGFSKNQGESEKAYDYILNYVAKPRDPNKTLQQVGSQIHLRFSKLVLNGPFNPTFAKFFMKYYHNDRDFMKFNFDGDDGYTRDYLCIAHNNFENILKNYPNRVVNGNFQNSLLTPEFVAMHSREINYTNINEGNEKLAKIVGKYGYTQEQFEQIQRIYDKAKTIKNSYIIEADRIQSENGINFRILDKDDPLGFVLGDITNCCQHIGGVGESCVDDGYTNPNAGFLVFEENILDEKGKSTGETRILGQAYIWYDPQTKTVCYDNIEIPHKIIAEMRNHEKGISSKSLMNIIEKSAEAIISGMKKRGIEVDSVTTGTGYNDVNKELRERFGKPITEPKAKHRGYNGYSDAGGGQYILKSNNKYKLHLNQKQLDNEFVTEI